MLKNRLVFVEGGRDDRLFLDQYVLLGNYVRDPDRLDVFDRLLVEFFRERVFAEATPKLPSEAAGAHESLVSSAARMREDLARLDEEREALFTASNAAKTCWRASCAATTPQKRARRWLISIAAAPSCSRRLTR